MYGGKNPFTAKKISVLLKQWQSTLDFRLRKKGEQAVYTHLLVFGYNSAKAAAYWHQLPRSSEWKWLSQERKINGLLCPHGLVIYATKMCHLWHKPKRPSLHLHQSCSGYLVHNLGDDCSGNIRLFCKALQEQNRRKLAVHLVVV